MKKFYQKQEKQSIKLSEISINFKENIFLYLVGLFMFVI